MHADDENMHSVVSATEGRAQALSTQTTLRVAIICARRVISREEVVNWAMGKGCEVGQNCARRTESSQLRLSADPADVK